MIAHFTSKLSGGAPIAALRLHYALQRGGTESVFYHGAGSSSDPSLFPLYQNESFARRTLASLAIGWRSRQNAKEGYINSPKWIRKTPLTLEGPQPETINLHSMFRWADLSSFMNSVPPTLPVVWSLHDLEPVTGGCIYPGTCEGFTKQCGNCPQLKRPYSKDITNRSFKLKEKLYERTNLHFVGNSKWTTDQARRSGLSKFAKSISTINLGLDIDKFQPVDKSLAKAALGLNQNKFVIGFACSDFSEKRKGGHRLIEALRQLPSEEILLLVFGSGSWPSNELDVETVSMGSIESPRLQSLYYSALDVFAMPTEIETFGNVAMEAMACETPVVGYRAGGLSDVIADGETGLLESEIGSVPGLVRMLRWMREHNVERLRMGKASRKRVEEKFSDNLMARRYSDLYREIIRAAK